MASWLRKIGTFLPQEIPGPIAVLYEKVAIGGLRGFHQQVASEITSSLKSGKILDVGTGPGQLLIEITRRNPNLELVGFDLSRKMLKIAKRLTEPPCFLAKARTGAKICAEAAATDLVPTTVRTDANPVRNFKKAEALEQVPKISNGANIRLVRGDVRNLPFSDGEFDLVVSTLSLHHWHDPARGIRECLRVTAAGGRCWIYDLRTDVPVRTHAKLVTGEGLGRLARSWIFKFHGVDPKQYEARTVTSWLGGGVTVQAEVHAAYLKLNIEKPLCESQEETIHSKGASLMSSVSLQT
ncbi:MAG: class I SAM-dependent methyltransferase [Planctomycetota bacterium]